ncbi:MAG: GAF domain-containing protein, partial [Spirochaetota bacterium]|nr:GAF domain-containing protein [Spirochaetota bacterium]
VFMTEDHPLVLFLDDLQWVDSASLNLIKILLTNHESKYLFMIGAYRNNEVDGNHPLTEALNEVRRFTFHVDKKMPINEILIEPLNLSHTKLWLSDTFNTSYIEELSVLVSDKTHGNPFFIKEFIKSLYDNKLIKLNTEKGIWEWDIKELKKRDFTDNVIDHMCNRIKNLSYETQKALSIASCIGTFFDLNDLSLIYDKTQKETINILREALFNELIIPIGDEYKYILSTDEVTDFKVSFKFVHDRVQQSVYSLVADTEKDKLHLKIGKLLLENTSSDDLEEKLLEIVDHLNISSHLISSKEEKIELSKLNLRAGQKAKISAAFNSALDYITKGMNLLSEDSWDNEYDLTYQLYIEKGELLYINAKYEDAEDNLNIALSKANTNMEKAKVYNLLMTICNSLSRYRDTISFGEKGFRLFGFTIPKTEKDLIREGIKEYEILKKRMAKKNIIDVFKNMSVPADINQTVILNFTLNFALSAFQIVKNDYLYTYIATKMMNFMLDNNIVSGSCLFMFALDLVRTHNNYDLANKLCELALEIEEKYNSPNIDAKLITYFAVYIQHWKKPFFESISTFNRAFQIAKEQRDKLALLYTVHHYPKHKYIKGMELNIVLDDIKKVIPYIQETYNIVLIILCRLFESTILNLKGLTKSQISFDNDSFTEEDYIKISKDPKYPFLYSRYCLAKSFTLFLFDHVEEAYNFAVECDKEILLYSAKGQAHIPEFYFTYSLILSNLYPSRKLNDKKKYMKTLSKLLAQMKEWGDNCPENYGHKYLLMSAEMMRIRGKDTSAMRLYKMAIKQAKDNMFLQDTAIANELAAKFYLYKGFEEIFSIYITESHYYYSLWGASAKVNDIELKYGDLLIKPSTKVNIDPTTTSTLSIAKTIDIKTVMNASQAISREIVLDNLLKRLMDIVITTSGASNGYFIMDIDNDLVVKAYRDVKNDGNANLDSIPVSNLTKFTQSLILYAKRTKEHIVINDVSNDDTFSKKLDKISDKAKSAMAIPILSKDKIIGILYLENHLTTGAFLDNKLELLKMLSSQIAISLENAMFYESLQKSQKEITRLNTKIHNSIMNKLKTIQGRIKLFEAKQANILDQQGFYDLNIINSLSSHASKECNNILFILGNHDCTIKSLIKEITFRADLSLVPYNIKYTMNCDSSLESVILPSESIQYLLDGYDEAINNILKHSKARNVDIGISNFTDGEINLSIKDDGIGFYIMNESSKQNSYGLKLMHQYSKQMNAKFDITADKGKGTLFSISIKIN